MKLHSIALATLSSLTAGAQAQTTVAQWDFNTGSLSASSGSGTASLFGGATSFGDFPTIASSPSDPSATNRHLEVNGYEAGPTSPKAGVAFAVSTLGMSGISVSFDTSATTRSSIVMDVQYSIDGTSWATVGSINFGGSPSWVTGQTFALGANANNQANVLVRMVNGLVNSGDTSYMPNNGVSYRASSPNSFDMVTVTAAVPEPGTWALMAAGLLGVGVLAKRRQAKQQR